MPIQQRKAVRVGSLGLLREVFQIPHPQPAPPPPTVFKSYRRTIEDILADTRVLGPTGCLEYTGRIHKILGYGIVRYHGKMWYTHRLVALYTQVHHKGWRDWLAAQRWIYVCHTCDNPPCINPNHLVIATPDYNVWDSIAKGRRSRSIDTLSNLRSQFQAQAEDAVAEAMQLVS